LDKKPGKMLTSKFIYYSYKIVIIPAVSLLFLLSLLICIWRVVCGIDPIDIKFSLILLFCIFFLLICFKLFKIIKVVYLRENELIYNDRVIAPNDIVKVSLYFFGPPVIKIVFSQNGEQLSVYTVVPYFKQKIIYNEIMKLKCDNSEGDNH